MAAVNQVFQSAPMGRRMIAPMVIGAVIIVGAVAFNSIFAVRTLPPHTPAATRVIVSLAPLVALLVAVPIFLFERSKTFQFRIEENCLVLGRKHLPFAGLIEAKRDPDVLCWAVRLWGNGGLGSVRGRFWSRRIGKFDAVLTNTEHAVVLRWPDKVVAVSPADPEFFIYSARTAAGLK